MPEAAGKKGQSGADDGTATAKRKRKERTEMEGQSRTKKSALKRIAKVIPARLERATHSLEGCCSIQLSYGTPINLKLRGTKIAQIPLFSKKCPFYRCARTAAGRGRFAHGDPLPSPHAPVAVV